LSFDLKINSPINTVLYGAGVKMKKLNLIYNIIFKKKKIVIEQWTQLFIHVHLN